MLTIAMYMYVCSLALGAHECNVKNAEMVIELIDPNPKFCGIVTEPNTVKTLGDIDIPVDSYIKLVCFEVEERNT